MTEIDLLKRQNASFAHSHQVISVVVTFSFLSSTPVNCLTYNCIVFDLTVSYENIYITKIAITRIQVEVFRIMLW
jgi:hypothetical protein